MVKKMKLIMTSIFKNKEPEPQPKTLSVRATDTWTEPTWLASSPETVVRSVVRSERLRCEPAGRSRSIMEEEKSNGSPFEVLVMESADPYGDFRRSMDEMVRWRGLEDWDSMLRWYLKVNGERNHGFIVGAFVDLLVGLADSGSGSDYAVSR